MPYSMGCATPLSNFEANQNYKDVTDPAGAALCVRARAAGTRGADATCTPGGRARGDGVAVIVSFPLVDQPEVSVVAWTTTPWTLPSNLGLCVHPTFDYVHIHGAARRETGRVTSRRRAHQSALRPR